MGGARHGSDPPLTETVTLWRPVGPHELALIEESGMKTFPPRLPEQPIFYPVTTEDYAVKIARDWSVPASGSGFVTQFGVDATSSIATGWRRRAGVRTANIGFRRRICPISTPRSSASSK